MIETMRKKKPIPAPPPEPKLTADIYQETAAVLKPRPDFCGLGKCPTCGGPRFYYAAMVAGPWHAHAKRGVAFVMHTIISCPHCFPMHEARTWEAGAVER